MDASNGTGSLEVRGGAAGLSAQLEDLAVLADEYDRAADRMRERATRGAATAVDPDLLASALLCPASFAEAEARVLAATAGPDGIGVEAIGWEADAASLRLVAGWLRGSDDLAAAAFGQLGLAVRAAPDWLPAVADLASRLYPHGRAAARPVPDVAVPSSTTAPGGVGDLVEHLQQLSTLADQPVHHGTVEVQTLTSPDGRVRHVLYLPGTDDMKTLRQRQ